MGQWYTEKQKIGIYLEEQTSDFLSAYDRFLHVINENTNWLLVPFIGRDALRFAERYDQELVAIVGDLYNIPSSSPIYQNTQITLSWTHGSFASASVATDYLDIGRKVARFFKSIGLKDVSLFKLRSQEENTELAEGFLFSAKEQQLHATYFTPENEDDISEWVLSLKQPHGVLGIDDLAASKIYRYAMDFGLTIPDKMAVMGCGDNPLFCQISGTDSLSSIELPMQEIGRKSAEYLIRKVIAGDDAVPAHQKVAGGQIKHRFSSSKAFYQDEVVLRALRHIEENYRDKLTTDMVAQTIGVSRRSLERHAKESLGSTVQKEIERIRFAKACQLLAGPQMSLDEVAYECGIASAWQLNRVFKRRIGKSPTEYRKDALTKHLNLQL